MLIGKRKVLPNYVAYSILILEVELAFRVQKVFIKKTKSSCNEGKYHLNFIMSAWSQGLSLSTQEIKLKTVIQLGRNNLNMFCPDSIQSW